MIGERVRLARDYLQISQQQLADAAGITQSAVSQIEAGGPAAERTVQRISDATGYSLGFFERGALPDLPETSLRYRKSAASRQRDEKRLRAHVRQGLELVSELEQHAQLPPLALQAASQTIIDDDALEQLALNTRRQLGIGPSDPVPNLVRAVERAGVVVFGASTGLARHDAVSVWPSYPIGRPIVCYARGRPGDRQRLSVAHEIGHLVLHQLRSVEPKRAESEAFRFGAALLVPRDAATESIRPPITLRTLAWAKARWGVSVAALIRRCRDLRIIDEHRYVSLNKQLSARGWRKHEPVTVPPERPALLSQTLRSVRGTDRPTAVSTITGLAPVAARDLVADSRPDATPQNHRNEPAPNAQVHQLRH